MDVATKSDNLGCSFVQLYCNILIIMLYSVIIEELNLLIYSTGSRSNQMGVPCFFTISAKLKGKNEKHKARFSSGNGDRRQRTELFRLCNEKKREGRE